MPSSSSRNSCYFCGKREDEVATLVAGPPPLFICNECVALASDIIAEEEGAAERVLHEPLQTSLPTSTDRASEFSVCAGE